MVEQRSNPAPPGFALTSSKTDLFGWAAGSWAHKLFSVSKSGPGAGPSSHFPALEAQSAWLGFAHLSPMVALPAPGSNSWDKACLPTLGTFVLRTITFKMTQTSTLKTCIIPSFPQEHSLYVGPLRNRARWPDVCTDGHILPNLSVPYVVELQLGTLC